MNQESPMLAHFCGVSLNYPCSSIDQSDYWFFTTVPPMMTVYISLATQSLQCPNILIEGRVLDWDST